jgi:hypothetical protein
MRVRGILRHPSLQARRQINGGHRLQQVGKLLNAIHSAAPFGSKVKFDLSLQYHEEGAPVPSLSL